MGIINAAQPVIELLFLEFLNEDQDALIEIEYDRPAECSGIRAVICTNNPNAINLDLGLGISSNEYVVPILNGPYAWFHSKGISHQTRLSDGRSDVLMDYSLSFDSNFSEKLRAVVFGENIGKTDRDAVHEIIMLKAKNKNVQFDVMPFIIENIRLVRGNSSNHRPLETLTAFRMLDDLDWDRFRISNGGIFFSRERSDLEGECRKWAKEFLDQLKLNGEISRIEMECVRVQALLLHFARLWDCNPKLNISKILRELLRFSIQKLRAIPLMELYMIWNGISKKSGLPFFGPVVGKSQDMLNKIRGMAWDMTILRNLERSATKTGREDFFIPYFVSLDRRLRELIRFGPIKSILIDDAIQHAISIRENELEFRVALQKIMEESDIRDEMTPEKTATRRKLAQSMNLSEIQNIITDEEVYWQKV